MRYIFLPKKYINRRVKYIFFPKNHLILSLIYVFHRRNYPILSVNWVIQRVKRVRKSLRHTRATPIYSPQRGDGGAHLFG